MAVQLFQHHRSKLSFMRIFVKSWCPCCISSPIPLIYGPLVWPQLQWLRSDIPIGRAEVGQNPSQKGLCLFGSFSLFSERRLEWGTPIVSLSSYSKLWVPGVQLQGVWQDAAVSLNGRNDQSLHSGLPYPQMVLWDLALCSTGAPLQFRVCRIEHFWTLYTEQNTSSMGTCSFRFCFLPHGSVIRKCLCLWPA